MVPTAGMSVVLTTIKRASKNLHMTRMKVLFFFFFFSSSSLLLLNQARCEEKKILLPLCYLQLTPVETIHQEEDVPNVDRNTQ